MERPVLHTLVVGRPGEDDATRAARVASAMFVGAAAVVLVTLPLLDSDISRPPIAVVAVVALVFGLAIPLVPWSRWGTRALLCLPVAGYVMLAVMGVIVPGAVAAYMALYFLTFVFIGLVARPGTSLLFLPLAVTSFLVGNIHDLSGTWVRVAIAAPIWVFVGELLARALAFRTLELERVADTDPLTMLENRRGCDRALAAMEAGDAVVLIDLDHFKAVNDHHGHQAGDEALCRLAAAMRAVTRNIDSVARYGGEEFAMVLARAGVRGAQDVLTRLREQWRPDEVATFSAGIAVHRIGENAETTLARADRALYEAKANGRDRVEVARNEFLPPHLERRMEDVETTA
ncbi:MAG TPA: GGDEF domain-containing protein [Acidimicrobiia bacterium]